MLVSELSISAPYISSSCRRCALPPRPALLLLSLMSGRTAGVREQIRSRSGADGDALICVGLTSDRERETTTARAAAFCNRAFDGCGSFSRLGATCRSRSITVGRTTSHTAIGAAPARSPLRWAWSRSHSAACRCAGPSVKWSWSTARASTAASLVARAPAAALSLAWTMAAEPANDEWALHRQRQRSERTSSSGKQDLGPLTGPPPPVVGSPGGELGRGRPRADQPLAAGRPDDGAQRELGARLDP